MKSETTSAWALPSGSPGTLVPSSGTHWTAPEGCPVRSATFGGVSPYRKNVNGVNQCGSYPAGEATLPNANLRSQEPERERRQVTACSIIPTTVTPRMRGTADR